MAENAFAVVRTPRLGATAVTPATYAVFEAEARAADFDQVLEHRWAPDIVMPTHTREA